MLEDKGHVYLTPPYGASSCLHFYAMGPFKVPSVPVTRHTNNDLSTLPADATHASSAENRTALTWLLCPLNLAHLAPFATHG